MDENLQSPLDAEFEEIQVPAKANSYTGRGMPPHQVTRSAQNIVRMWVALGATQEQIARKLGISQDTLVKYYRNEYETGHVEANMQIGGVLFKKALEGDTASVFFYLKTRAGYKEISVNQNQNLDEHGNPTAAVIDVTPTAVLQMIQQAKSDV